MILRCVGVSAEFGMHVLTCFFGFLKGPILEEHYPRAWPRPEAKGQWPVALGPCHQPRATNPLGALPSAQAAQVSAMP